MKGVSPLIAEIILIAIVFSIATAVIVVLGGVSFSVRTLDAKLGVDGFEWRSQRLVIHHLGGDIIRNAFLIRDGVFYWGDLVVKKSGREVEALYPRLNGKRAEYLIYEDMDSPPLGVLKRSALHLPENRWVRLTLSARENGQLEYILSPPPSSFVVEFQFWAGGGRGEGSTWFYAYCGVTPENENWPPAGGYVFAYNENSDKLEVWYGGERLAADNMHSINDNRWHEARIVFDGMVIEMYLDNRLDNRIRYIDYKAANRKGKSLFGWGARAGGDNNEHRIRNLRMWVRGETWIDFSPGDVLEFEMKDPLVIGDAMTITYLPQNKLLYMNDIS
ncbi:MAG: hypothetical protein QXF20_04735 [Candidatus Hadarchaeales archaeon]